ncbi:hypothetical protein Tco_0557312 [Tanacetum coccineum]
MKYIQDSDKPSSYTPAPIMARDSSSDSSLKASYQIFHYDASLIPSSEALFMLLGIEGLMLDVVVEALMRDETVTGQSRGIEGVQREQGIGLFGEWFPRMNNEDMVEGLVEVLPRQHSRECALRRDSASTLGSVIAIA